jgi:hypothetical protein
MCSKCFCEFDEVRITKLEPPTLHPSSFLLPLDHTIRSIVEDNESDVKLKSYGSLDISEIHDESTISCDADDISFRIRHLSRHSSRESSTHSCECIVKKECIRCITWIIPCYPDLIESIIERENVFFLHILPEYLRQLTRSHDRCI